MKRRGFVGGLGGLAATWPLGALAKPNDRLLRIGAAGFAPKSAPFFVAFERRLAELGYRDGETYTFDYVRTNGPSPDDYEAGYRRAVERDPDVIFVAGSEFSLKAALAASRTTPIVLIAINFDPIARGYAASLSHPGGRITGVFSQASVSSAKRLELLKEAIPGFKSAIVFFDRFTTDEWAAVEAAGDKHELRLFGLNLHDPPFDYESAFAKTEPNNRENLFVIGSPRFVLDREHLVSFALRNRLRSCFDERPYVEVGGLMSFGTNIHEMFRRGADYVDRIAQGATPADLPLELPTKFELVVNLGTARTLGLNFSPNFLARADEVLD